jgi:hypothetical protein
MIVIHAYFGIRGTGIKRIRTDFEKLGSLILHPVFRLDVLPHYSSEPSK